ncbi:hypothetical protein [Leucobacter chromiireducens]|uniref:Glutaminase n=1 Tax=Leucobacter chromiireducens subsp. solipictus TaxID=398235 RepID=A0ABS1SFE6_9MICO|nr:hypothetical protein [Leucobacter chromiireducens]MBL3678752.1 hypothetical protein [Leucobacter chromiireducens subsp. solipictus]
MTAAQDFEAALSRATDACADTAAGLAAAGIPPEHLARVVTPRKILLWARPDTMQEFGSAWRLGTVLLGTDARLYAAGRATRAAERGRPGYQSVSREERREIAAAALRGGIPAGEPVNFDATPIPLRDSEILPDARLAELLADPELPVGYSAGEIRVRWRAGAPLEGAPSLADFLRERAELLRHPRPE